MPANPFTMEEPEIILDEVDVSCWANNLEITASKAEIEANTFCGQNVRAGLEESSFSFGFVQDFDAAAIDSVLWPLWDTSAEFEVSVKPVKGEATSATNPEFHGTCILLEYQPLSGGPGDLAEFTIDLKVIGKLTRVEA